MKRIYYAMLILPLVYACYGDSDKAPQVTVNNQEPSRTAQASDIDRYQIVPIGSQYQISGHMLINKETGDTWYLKWGNDKEYGEYMVWEKVAMYYKSNLELKNENEKIKHDYEIKKMLWTVALKSVLDKHPGANVTGEILEKVIQDNPQLDKKRSELNDSKTSTVKDREDLIEEAYQLTSSKTPEAQTQAKKLTPEELRKLSDEELMKNLKQ